MGVSTELQTSLDVILPPKGRAWLDQARAQVSTKSPKRPNKATPTAKPNVGKCNQ